MGTVANRRYRDEQFAHRAYFKLGALLDRMNLQDSRSALIILSLIKIDYESTIEQYRPKPHGGLNMNVSELFRFAKEIDQIATENDRARPDADACWLSTLRDRLDWATYADVVAGLATVLGILRLGPVMTHWLTDVAHGVGSSRPPGELVS